MKIAEIAAAIGAEIVGDSEAVIERIRPLDTAGDGDLTFLLDGREPPPPETVSATAVIVNKNVDGDRFPETSTLLRTDNAYLGFARALDLVYPEPPPPFDGIDDTAQVHESASLGGGARLAAGVVIGAAVTIGERCTLHPGVTIGTGCRIGDDVVMHPRATLYAGVTVGDRCILHAGAVIGSDGFGFAPGPQGIVKIRHQGRVRLGNDVEVGANSTIDCGVLDDTVVGDGTKIDNLVQLGHNVVIGRHCVIAGQSGLAGSCVVGDGVKIAGQVGLGGHLKVGDGAQIGAKSGVHSDVPAGQKVLGSPAVDLRTARRAYAVLYKLPEVRQRVDHLTRRLEQILPAEETTD